MAPAQIFIKLVWWVLEPPLHLSPHSTLQVIRHFPPIRISDLHVLPDYTGALVAERADDSFWFQGLSMWPYPVYGMHLVVNLVPPMLSPLLATTLGRLCFSCCARGGTESMTIMFSHLLRELQTQRYHRHLLRTRTRSH